MSSRGYRQSIGPKKLQTEDHRGESTRCGSYIQVSWLPRIFSSRPSCLDSVAFLSAVAVDGGSPSTETTAIRWLGRPQLLCPRSTY